MSEMEVRPPDFDDLIGELNLLRRSGITELRILDLPALRRAVAASGRESQGDASAPQIEALLRVALERLGGGRLGESAARLFGLEPGTRADTPQQLREDAAERWGVGVSRFRHRWEPVIISQLAESLLTLCEEHRLRVAYLSLERKVPTSSRLAVAWVERFEAMYRIWTQLYAVGADLTAYRSTHLRQYGDDVGLQADGYVRFAIGHFASFLAELKRYENRHGGHWLLSDRQAEQDVTDAVYRVGWHTPNNERDDSYLRHTWEDLGGELHPFLGQLASDGIGRSLHDEWLGWASECQCEWTVGESEAALFPTSATEPGIDPKCALHEVVRACADYCLMLDDDWARIADWYHLPADRPSGVSAEQLMSEYVTAEPPDQAPTD